MSMAFRQISGVNEPGVLMRDRPFGIPPKSNPDSADDQSHLPTLCQVIAMSMCYRRLMFVILFIPFIFAISPSFLYLVFSILNRLFSGYGLLGLLMTALLTHVWNYFMRSVAPSAEKIEEAYQKDQIRLPFLMFVVSFLILHGTFWVVPSAKLPSVLGWVPTRNIGLGPAFGFLVIGGAVVLRFVGQSSYVRCSTVPLVSNGYVNYFRNGSSALSSVLFMMASPNDARQVPGPVHVVGRRYQCPTIMACVVNFIFTVLLGFVVSEMALVPCWKMLHTDLDFEDTKRSRLVVMFSCIATMVLQLLVSGFGGSNHELNPQRYYKPMTGSIVAYLPIGGTVLVETLKQVAICAIPILASVVGLLFLAGVDLGLFLEKETWPLVSFCLVASIGVASYAATLEESVKAALCIPGTSLLRLVREFTVGADPNSLATEDEESYMVDVMLHSLLHGDGGLVKEIWRPTLSKNTNDLQRHEATRNREATWAMGWILLGVVGKRAPEASMEEDVLRHAILESMGGSSSSISTVVQEDKQGRSTPGVLGEAVDNYPMSEHHRATIEYWIENPFALKSSLALRLNSTTSGTEARGVLLVRALCAYTGGLGRALMECSKTPPPNSWLIRPGTLVAAEYSAIAVARCVQQIFWNAKTSAVDWNLTQVSQLIPAALNSCYCLHDGILHYAHYLEGQRSNQAIAVQGGRFSGVHARPQEKKSDEQIIQNYPDLKMVLYTIQHSARMIMQQVVLETGSGFGTVSLRTDLDDGCEQWLERIPISHGTR